MKTFKEFAKNYEAIRANTKMDLKDFDEVVKRHYEKYKDYWFNVWLSEFDADAINQGGIELYRKIFDAMAEEAEKEINNGNFKS